MMKMQPLQLGDEIRVIAPSQSWQPNREASYKRAEVRLKEAGFKLSFGRNSKLSGRFGTATVNERLQDLNDAYEDKNIKAIICARGGWSANELLPLIDWGLIKANPKPMIGFSDITVLLNAIYAKTGQIGLTSSKLWADWTGVARKTRPWRVIIPGNAQGVIVGGNLGSFYLLQGTQYQPAFDKDIILTVEDDDEAGTMGAREFDRRLESILQLPSARIYIKGVIIGRFQPASKVTMPDIIDIVNRKFDESIPVFADIDFGHTLPLMTLPIGGKLKMNIINNRPRLELVE
jgi:muramoyltetrapeptide carboxypeptidase